MYIKIPIQSVVNDTILNKPVMQDGKPVGIITHYDEKYIYGTIWAKHAIELMEYDNKLIFSSVQLSTPWNVNKEE